MSIMIVTYVRRASLTAMSGSCSRIASSTVHSVDISSNKKQQRYFSSNNNDDDIHELEPTINTQEMQSTIINQASQMATSLTNNGYYTTTNFLPPSMISILRSQAITLRNNGRYEQSWSEKIVNGKAERFYKDGVYACEPDGQDYYTAPDLITYMSILLQTLPSALNEHDTSSSNVELSNTSFNAKLAVTLPGGFKYPLHIDNPQGVSVGDIRKLTCILYLNPNYNVVGVDGGELRLFLPSKKMKGNDKELEDIDITPEGGRLVLFWSDEIPHEVLATAGVITPALDDEQPDDSVNTSSSELDRYALTVWIPTENIARLHNESSKFCHLKDFAF